MPSRIVNVGALSRGAILAMGCFCALAVTVRAEDTIPPEYRKTAQELFTITKVESLSLQMVDTLMGQLLPAFNQVNPGKESDVSEILREEFTLAFAGMMPKFTEEMLKIYYKHFDQQDLIAMLDFYKSPIGKKFIDRMPLITQDSMNAGIAMGRQVAAAALLNCVRRMQEKGLNTPKLSI